MELARDKYVDRMEKNGIAVRGNITKPPAQGKSWKTCDPDVPVFSERIPGTNRPVPPKDRHILHKFAGTLVKGQYKRYFTIEEKKQELKYYESEEAKDPKKTMDLTGANAFVQSRVRFDEEPGKDRGDLWSEDKLAYRVGIQMKGRGMKPVYCYAGIHDAKFLVTEVNFAGNRELADAQRSLAKVSSLLH